MQWFETLNIIRRKLLCSGCPSTRTCEDKDGKEAGRGGRFHCWHLLAIKVGFTCLADFRQSSHDPPGMSRIFHHFFKPTVSYSKIFEAFHDFNNGRDLATLNILHVQAAPPSVPGKTESTNKLDAEAVSDRFRICWRSRRSK